MRASKIVKIYFKVVFDNRYYWRVDSTVPWRHKLSIPNMGYVFQDYRSGSFQRLSKQPSILPFLFVDHLKKIVRFYCLRRTLLLQEIVKSMENRLWNSLTSGWFSYSWKILCRFLGVKITSVLFFSTGLCMLQYWSTKIVLSNIPIDLVLSWCHSYGKNCWQLMAADKRRVTLLWRGGHALLDGSHPIGIYLH